MKIAFSGAAGIGKTTTATALAEALQLPLLPESFDGLFQSAKKLRAAKQDDTTDSERLASTHDYLRTVENWLRQRAKQNRDYQGFIADRWALDMLTSLLANSSLRAHNQLISRLIHHVQQQAKELDLLVMLPLTGDWATEANEANLPRPQSFSTQLIMHSLCRGLHSQLTRVPVLHIPSRHATIDDRVKMIIQTLEKIRRNKNRV